MSDPIPMLLWCPSCGERHIDEGAFATRSHTSHACQTCGMVWRPSVEATVGVQFLPGYKNFPRIGTDVEIAMPVTDTEVNETKRKPTDVEDALVTSMNREAELCAQREVLLVRMKALTAALEQCRSTLKVLMTEPVYQSAGDLIQHQVVRLAQIVDHGLHGGEEKDG